jgi:threonine/homoserine/homoserine lactone efflux protein
MSNNLGNDDAAVNIYIGIIGGVILIIFGTVTFIKKPDILKRRSPTYKTPVKIPGPVTYIFKGFFLNIMNPFLIFFWFAAMNWVTANAEEGMVLKYAITFFSGTLITIFSVDLLKSYIGVRIKKYLKLRVILWVNRVVGLILITFGIGLIFTSITNFL